MEEEVYFVDPATLRVFVAKISPEQKYYADVYVHSHAEMIKFLTNSGIAYEEVQQGDWSAKFSEKLLKYYTGGK